MQKSKILAFLLALVVSIVLWFYAVTVVNPDDTITISGISVQFEGTEALTSQGLMLTGGDSTKVSIKVSGRRSDLKELNNETVTAIADVTRIAASGSYQLSWSVVWPSTVATGDISETSRAPSRISVTVSDIKENPEVPIELEYTGEPKTGYMIDKSNLTLGTQSISVRGPAEEVNKIARAVVRVDVTDADALIDTDCPVVLLDKDGNKLTPKEITGNYDTVSVSMPVLMNKDLPLTVSLVGGAGATEDNCVIEIEPKSIQVAGDTTVLQTLNQLVVATVDLSSFATSYETTVTIPLDNNLRNLSGVTEATVRISVRGLETEKITATNITTTGTNRHVEIATASLVVTVRAPAETISQITADNIRVVADLTNYKATSGTVAVPAKVYVDGFSDAGAIGEYVVNVHFTGG